MVGKERRPRCDGCNSMFHTTKQVWFTLYIHTFKETNIRRLCSKGCVINMLAKVKEYESDKNLVFDEFQKKEFQVFMSSKTLEEFEEKVVKLWEEYKERI